MMAAPPLHSSTVPRVPAHSLAVTEPSLIFGVFLVYFGGTAPSAELDPFEIKD